MDAYGKKFETKVKADLQRLDKAWVLRLPDQMTGHIGTSQNLCDFLCFWKSKLFLLECKTTKENGFYFSSFRQYDILTGIAKDNIPNIYIGVIIWFTEADKIIYVPIQEAKRMKENGLKSINIKSCLDGTYNIIDIPTTKKRVFFECDFSFLNTLIDYTQGDK